MVSLILRLSSNPSDCRKTASKIFENLTLPPKNSSLIGWGKHVLRALSSSFLASNNTKNTGIQTLDMGSEGVDIYALNLKMFRLSDLGWLLLGSCKTEGREG